MGVRFEVVQSAAPTSSGTQDFTFAGFGTPKAAILIINNASVSGVDISDAVIGIGLTDGVRQFATCGISQNGVGTANTFSHITNSGCILLLESSAGGIDGEASFDSWITDGLRINWSDAPISGVLVTAVLINGTDLSAYVGDFTSAAATGNSVDITAPNFQPDQLIILSAGPISTYNNSISDMHVSIGFVDNGGSIVQCSANEFSNDAATLGDTRDNISSIYGASTVIGSDIEISGFDAQGFSAFTRTVAGGFKYPYLALAYSGAVSHWVGIINSPIATGNQSVTTPGFKPQFVMHCPNAVATIDGDRTTDSTGAGTISAGVFTATDAFITSIEDQDTADPMRARSSTYSLPVKYDSGLGTNLHTATFVSFDPSGWTLNYSVANATTRKWPSFVVGQSVSVITDNIDLFISGPIQITDNIDLFVHGIDFLIDSLDLFIQGHESSTDSLDLFLDGNDLITDSLTLYISTIEVVSISNSLDIFIHGFDTFSNNLDLFISHSEPSSSDIDLFIKGLDFISNSLDLTIFGHNPINDTLNLFIIGPIQITDNINLFLKVPEQIVDSFTLFITGYKESIFSNLFLKTGPNDVTTNQSLFIHGSLSGINLGFTGNDINLFIRCEANEVNFPPQINIITNLFIKVTSGNLSGNGYWSLFLASNTVSNNNIDLFISTENLSINDTIDLFIARLPDFPGQEGFTPINDNWTLFLKTLNGNTDNIDMFIGGIPISGTLISTDIDLFIEGIIAIDNSLNLLLFGVLGVPNNNVDLCEFGIDDMTKNIKLFIRGC